VGEPRGMVACRFGKKKIKNATQKSFQPLLGQKKLRFGGQPLHTKDDKPKSVPESESVAGSASTSEKRKFLPQWLKIYSWLKYDKDKNFMHCDVCTKFNRKNSLH